jgi:hypothetical protein
VLLVLGQDRLLPGYLRAGREARRNGDEMSAIEEVEKARQKLRATQLNWQEQCLFECDKILTRIIEEYKSDELSQLRAQLEEAREYGNEWQRCAQAQQTRAEQSESQLAALQQARTDAQRVIGRYMDDFTCECELCNSAREWMNSYADDSPAGDARDDPREAAA